MTFKCSNPPNDLSAFVALAGEGQNDMVMSRRQRITAGGMGGNRLLIGIDNFLVGIRRVLLQPLHQTFADAEADVVKVTRFGIGIIGGGIDALVPIFVGGGIWFFADFVGEWVSTRRLAKMTVNN